HGRKETNRKARCGRAQCNRRKIRRRKTKIWTESNPGAPRANERGRHCLAVPRDEPGTPLAASFCPHSQHAAETYRLQTNCTVKIRSASPMYAQRRLMVMDIRPIQRPNLAKKGTRTISYTLSHIH